MNNAEIRETLEKQLRLLSERCENPSYDDNLAELTLALLEVARELRTYQHGSFIDKDVLMGEARKITREMRKD